MRRHVIVLVKSLYSIVSSDPFWTFSIKANFKFIICCRYRSLITVSPVIHHATLVPIFLSDRFSSCTWKSPLLNFRNHTSHVFKVRACSPQVSTSTR
uniref:Putative secreted protein n=1 Tax=Xenopsylla cheopis TaxID=163159 RepID=A0A6M2E158_XENCH